MTKKEVIKQEWVAIYGEEKYELIKYAIKENGYIDCVRNPEISKIISTTQKGICWGTTDYMPCNLKGVHNNNGWVKIESIEDLPKENGLKCLFLNKNNMHITYISDDVLYDSDWFFRRYTHWKIKNEFKYPLY